MDTLLFLALPLLLLISALCAGMETGVFALSRWRIKQLSKRKVKRAQALHRYLENSENFLWTIFVGNTLAACVAIAIVARAIQIRFAGAASVEIALFALAVFGFYTLCDLLPKLLFRQFPNRLCMLAVPFFRLLHIALSPVTRLAEALANLLLGWTGGKAFTGHLFSNRGDLRVFMQDTGDNLSSDEKAMINRVLELPALRVQQITIPMDKVPDLPSTATVEQAFQVFKSQPHNSLPVFTGTGKERRVAGIFHLKSLLYNPDIQLKDPVSRYLTSVLYFEEDSTLEHVLRRMEKTGQRMAVVLARNRQEIGIVTLESVLNMILQEGGG